MEQSSSGLYSGPLSQAAQKILAVLRAQNLCPGRRNYNYSYNHRQTVGRLYGSQRELLAQSSWSSSQEEEEESRRTDRPWSTPQVPSLFTSNQWQSFQTAPCHQSSQTPDGSLSSPGSSCWDSSLQRQPSQMEAYYQCSQIYAHRTYSKPPAYPCSQSLPSAQPETVAPSSHSDRYTKSLQIPERPFEHEATLWRNSTEEIRPSFILNLSPDDNVTDEVEEVFPCQRCPRRAGQKGQGLELPVSTSTMTTYNAGPWAMASTVGGGVVMTLSAGNGSVYRQVNEEDSPRGA
uniref:uncharacterized protein LOC124055035 n=1 Tax=Scatophagus argus TaxID=75038 RepID=UPI001ED81B09|nr:uncharacterized protein LOC124055035 [Scatophagus argus]